MPVDRTDEHDEVYRTVDEKARAIVAEIADCHRRGQPVLVGTTSIEKSEQLSALLKDRKYIRELGQYFKKHAAALKDGKEDELKQQLTEVAGYLDELGRKNSGDPVPASGAQRALSRAGSQHHRPGRRSGHGDHRHQHGRPRHRHSARRQRPLPRARLDEGGAGGGPLCRRARRGRRPGAPAQVDRRHPLPRRRLDRDAPQSMDRRQVADSDKEQAAAGQEPGPRETVRKRREIEGDRRGIAEKRSRDRQGIRRQRQVGRARPTVTTRRPTSTGSMPACAMRPASG